MITENIVSFIPQRHPFVMIDKLLFADESIACTEFTVAPHNILVEGNEFSEAGLLENIAQTVAAGAGYRAKTGNKPVATGYIGAVKNFEVFALPVINDVLTTDVVIEQEVFNFTIVKGKILCNKIVIARCEMKVFTELKQ